MARSELTGAQRSRSPLAVGLLTALGLAVTLSACSGAHSVSTSPSAASSSPAGTSSGSPSASAPPAVKAVITPGAAVHNGMNPVAPVSLTVAHGTFTDVTMTNQAGKAVTATAASGSSSWHTTEVLGYGRTYTIVARAQDAVGATTTETTKFTTLNPTSTADATMDRMGGYALDSGTYGVAIIPVVHFDSAVQDEKSAQKALTVKTSAPVAGVWSWIDNQDAAYRPKSYWPTGTKVTVDANVYGVNLGDGEYGESDVSVDFTVGRKQLTVADDNAPKAVDKVRVYDASGDVLRTMNTSMGQHTGETVNGNYINFYTLNGTYTVLEHDNPAIMSSQSYGLPQNAPNGYGKLTVPYSTKISTDGIYLHEYNSTIYDQDHGNDVSEGCLNLRTADASWFYKHSLVGDPVVVHGASGAPEIAPDEGGYWSIPWSTWVKKSATA